jgi:hypothetical protein
LVAAKYEILSKGIRRSIQGFGRFGCLSIGVHAEAAEIMTKPTLHQCTRSGIYWSAGRTQPFSGKCFALK